MAECGASFFHDSCWCNLFLKLRGCLLVFFFFFFTIGGEAHRDLLRILYIGPLLLIWDLLLMIIIQYPPEGNLYTLKLPIFTSMYLDINMYYYDPVFPLTSILFFSLLHISHWLWKRERGGGLYFSAPVLFALLRFFLHIYVNPSCLLSQFEESCLGELYACGTYYTYRNGRTDDRAGYTYIQILGLIGDNFGGRYSL